MNNKLFLPFRLDTIFKISASSSGIDKNKLLSMNGRIPYVTRSDKNNGIVTFVGEQDVDKYQLDVDNVITIGLDTQTVFYQPSPFYTGQNIQILRSPDLNFEVAMYLIPLLKKVLTKFSWGSNGATLSRLRRSMILLPVDQNKRPDYLYMKHVIHRILRSKLQDISDYYVRNMNGITYQTVPDLTSKKWAEFFLISDELFSLDIVKPLKSTSIVLEDGLYDVVGATSKGNGHVGFLGADYASYVVEGNCICLIKTGQGSVGEAVYKYHSFIPSNNVAVIRGSRLNLYTGLFLVNQINSNSSRYSYGYIRNQERIMNEKILLPIDEKGHIDFGYMEQYIKNIIYGKYQDYVAFKKI